MERQIGNNLSSGAEKTEALAEQAEREAADARFEAAKARAEQKRAKNGERADGAERLAAQEARRRTLAEESEAERIARKNREKRARMAARSQKAAARQEAQREKQEARRRAQEGRAAARAKKKQEGAGGGKKRAPGIGGWIAAVSVLGAACLALTAAVTVGYFRTNDLLRQSANGYRATLFELVSVSEGMDDSFCKLRVSSGAGEQRTLLTEILVGSALMESAVERMPVDAATGTDISAFVNLTNMAARRMLRKIAAGSPLSAEDLERLQKLCAINAGLSRELNDLALHTPEKELLAFFGGTQGAVSDRLFSLGEGVREELFADAPFAGEGIARRGHTEGVREITAADAEQKVRQYFEDYRITDVRLTGETHARGVRAYNFVLTDEGGTEYFAQVAKGGELVFFDSYEVCTVRNFDLGSCDTLARAHLQKLGYEHLTPVWFSDAGNVAAVTYVAEREGVRIYSEMIRVRVCEEKGRVVGMDAGAFLRGSRSDGRSLSPGLSRDAAQARLSPTLAVQSVHLALIPAGGEETLAYEFYCTAGEDAFLVYLDADTGEEVRIFRVHESAQGSYLS